MTVIAGVDVGNATTEVVLLAGREILGAGRVPTRGRKGSADSLRGAASLVRRIERQAGCTVTEARIAPLRAVDTSVVTVPDAAPPSGRLRVLAVGVATPGGDRDLRRPAPAASCRGPARRPKPGWRAPPAAGRLPRVAVVPAGLRYDQAAARLRDLLAAGTPVGAVLVAGDEGVLVANRLPAGLPVIDQVDAAAAAACRLLAVEVRPPGHALDLLANPVALGARLGLGDAETGDAVTVSRALADHSNAVVGLLARAAGAAGAGPDEPWVAADGRRVPLRAACARIAGWPVGAVRVFGTASGEAEVDDLFAVDLAAAAEAATARQGSTGRAVLVASLGRAQDPLAAPAAGLLSELLAVPVNAPLTEPAAARLGALTTPGARPDAVVVDLGAGTIDVIGAASRRGGRRGRRTADRRGGRDARHTPRRPPTGSSAARACGWTAGSGSRPRTAAAASWPSAHPPRRPGCSWSRVPAACCRSTAATARGSGGPSGCGSSWPCWPRISSGPCGRSGPAPGRSWSSEGRPEMRNYSA